MSSHTRGGESGRSCGSTPSELSAAATAFTTLRVRVSEAARPCRSRVDVHMVVLNSAEVMSTARDVQSATQRP